MPNFKDTYTAKAFCSLYASQADAQAALDAYMAAQRKAGEISAHICPYKATGRFTVAIGHGKVLFSPLYQG